jgi:hypothetical protein
VGGSFKSLVIVAFGGTVFSSRKDWKSDLHWVHLFQLRRSWQNPEQGAMSITRLHAFVHSRRSAMTFLG